MQFIAVCMRTQCHWFQANGLAYRISHNQFQIESMAFAEYLIYLAVEFSERIHLC